jgi:hypothetical protein
MAVDNEVFKKVISNIPKGIPIYKTLKYLKISSPTFYKQLTTEQKLELQHIKVAHSSDLVPAMARRKRKLNIK